MLTNTYRKEVDAILSRYPPENKRAAVMPLLYLAQREQGFLSEKAIQEVAALLDLDPTQVGGLVRFYSLYHTEPGGKYRIQICTDLPCALRGAERFAEAFCARLGVSPEGVSDDGLFGVEEVMCLAACDRAPMFQVQDADGIHYHENQTAEAAMAWVEQVRSEESHA